METETSAAVGKGHFIMKNSIIVTVNLLIVLIVLGCTHKTQVEPLQAVAFVDLEKYAGRWFEIARYPHRFEEGCSDVTADYARQADGTITVVNQCRLEEEGGEIKKASGLAKVVDSQSNAKLKVSFFWPFYGDYWILKLDPHYQYAVVGEPSRKYVWILSRTPTISEKLLAELIEDIRSLGYDPSRLILTRQSATEPG